MDVQRFRVLSTRQKALIAIAVLLDGREAAEYLENDLNNGPGLKRAAIDLASQDPEVRMAYLGTMLRESLNEEG